VQRILDDAALEIEKIQQLFVNGRCPREHQAEASERLTRLKDEWEQNLKSAWRGTPAELIMHQAAVELSALRRNSRPTPKWSSVLYQVHGTLTMHRA